MDDPDWFEKRRQEMQQESEKRRKEMQQESEKRRQESNARVERIRQDVEKARTIMLVVYICVPILY